MPQKTQRPQKKRSGVVVLALVLLLAVALVVVCVLALTPGDAGDAQTLFASPAHQEPPAETDEPSQAEPPAETDELSQAEPPAETDEPSQAEPLTCYIIDVWQGDSILLVSPSGKTMLIDAGDADHYDRVMAQLDALNITYLDVLVATHPHGDHIGAMGRLVKNVGVGACYLTEYTSNIFAYTRLLDALEDHSVPIYTADSDTEIFWDAACPVTVLSPVAGVRYEELNASSIVLRVDYGDTSLLLTGDATIETEDVMLATYPRETLRADVLKLGHHGSSDATSERFFNAVAPTLAVASLGAGNDYGHPHREILALMQEYGLTLHRTDELGTIKIVLDGAAAAVVQ